MKVIGIDPGLQNTGYAIIENNDLIGYGVIKPKDKGYRRFEEISKELSEIINEHSPEICGIESIFFMEKSTGAVIKMAELRGAILGVLGKLNLRILNLPPAFIKKSITGNGRASKEQVKYMVAKLFKLDEKKLKKDEADAIAIAYCTYYSFNRKISNI